MARKTEGSVARQIRALFNLGVVGERSDGQLLERFATAGGEAAELAFAALVERHGPMVLRICRGVLRDGNDVEDAFQATFLVLVRRARSLWVEDSLGPWLHRVARRVAMRARAEATRRRERERRAAEARPMIILDADHDDSLLAMMHEEIDRLPDRCRAPVVLCDVQGLTHEQAARHLGWPIGTVKSRLMSGRERLRGRLVRRGVAPAMGLMEMMTGPVRSACLRVPAGLMEATVRSARIVAAGAGPTAAGAVPATVTLLMKGVLDAMWLTRISFAILACGLVVGGAVAVAQQAGRRPQAATPRPANARAAAPAAIPADAPADGQADVAKEMAQLELGLLEDEVKLLRTQVGDALKIKVEYETGISRADPKAWDDAQRAYEIARRVYLEKARELASARRRIGKVEDPTKADAKGSGDAAPGEDHGGGKKADGRGAPAFGAAVGSIDMDAVSERYAKARHLEQRLSQFRGDARDRIARLEADAAALAARIQRLNPGSSDQRSASNHLAKLKAQIGIESDEAQQETSRLEAQQYATIVGELHEAIAAVARAKGLDYVVQIGARPKPNADYNQLIAAMNRSVLYANPSNDITEEVIRELNRRFEAK